MNLNARIERKEPRLSDGWDLRSILHFEKNKTCALTVVVRKIDGLRFQICQNGLDGRAELSGLRGRVSGLHGDVDLQQEPHRSPLESLLLEPPNPISLGIAYSCRTGSWGRLLTCQPKAG